MLRRVDNPPNPFVREMREWLGPAPRVDVELFEEDARSILSRNDSPDIPFRFSVNPYRGCQHACAYCYARTTHEYLGMGAGTDFDSKLVVKKNAAELLAQALGRPTWRREWLAFSGATDCYQPFEVIYQLTRACLEVCADFRTPASIITKSFLITRDLDILQQLNRAAGVRVNMSIPFASDRVARKIEPGAPPPSRRFEAVRRLSAAGIDVGVFVAPLIPGLNDREVAMVLERAADVGATSASYIPLRLPGSVADVFLKRLRGELPLHAARVEARIRAMRGGCLNEPRFGARMRGEGPYWQSVASLFAQTARRVGLDVPHRTDVESALTPAKADSCTLPQPALPPQHVRPAPNMPGAQLPLFPSVTR